MRVSIDIDNVIQDWQGGWSRLYNAWFDRHLGPNDLTEWESCVNSTHFATPDEFWAWHDRAHVFEQLDFIPGARGGVDHLIARFPIVINTARPDGPGSTTARAMVDDLWPRAALVTGQGDKTLVPAGVHIDDSPKIAAQFQAKDKPFIIFDQPWNRDVEEGPNTIRAYDWDDVLAAVHEFADREGDAA